MPTRALVFDFDGLILDTETPDVVAWQTIFKRFDSEFPRWWWDNAIGRGAEQHEELPFDILVRQTGLTLDHEEIEHERKAIHHGLIDAQDALPGVRETIAAARAGGWRLGVASSSKHTWVEKYLARLELLGEFEAILCAEDVTRAKPFPDLYLAAVQALGATPVCSVALEDSPNGIRAAKAAGLYCVAVPNEMTRDMPLQEADLILQSLLDFDLDGITLPARAFPDSVSP